MSIYDKIGIPSIKHHRAIGKLTELLKTYFGIDRFWRNCHRTDGTYTLIGNYPPTGEFFFGQELYKGHPYFRNPIFFKSSYSIPQLLQNNEFEITQGKLKHDCYHIFLRIRKTQQGFIEYGFATSKPYMGFEMTYLNNLNAIDKFINYFEANASKIIQDSENHQVDISKIIGVIYDKNPRLDSRIMVPDKELAFLASIEKNPEISRGLLELTPNEKVCLKEYLAGNTAKEIGKKLFRSTRTIESHLQNSKSKLGINNRSCLIQSLAPYLDVL